MVKSGIAKFVQWLGYGLGNRGSSVRLPARAKHSSPKYSDCFSCPPSLLVNYYWGLFPHGQRVMHLITHICYVLRLRRSGSIPHPPYAFMPFTLTMVSLSGRSYTTDRQMAIDREREGMHVQLPEPWYTTSFLCLLPLHVTRSTVLKKYNGQQKKSPSKRKPLHSR